MDITERFPPYYEDHYRAFVNRFPTVESRFEVASQLAVETPRVGEGETLYESRYILASHWGEDALTLREVAFDIYGLKEQVDDNIDRPAIVLRKGSLENIWKKSDDGYCVDRLSNEVKFDFGYINTDELIMGFDGNITSSGRSRMGVRPPFVAFGAQLPIRNHSSITMDVFGNTIIRPSETEITPVAAYYGTIPLEFNRDVYLNYSKTERRLVFLGEQACSLLTQLTQKVKFSKTLNNLSELALRSL